MSESEPARSPSLKHELRTPLNHILGYCEMSIEEAQDRGQAAMIPDLQRIHAAGRELLTVIDNLFDPARPGAVRLTDDEMHHFVRTPLNQIIGYAEMLQEQATDSGQLSFIADFQKIHGAARQLLDLAVTKLIPGKRDAVGHGGAGTFTRNAAAKPISDAPQADTAPAQLEPGLLLVVDDNELNRDMLTRRLERLGHKVAVAENGRDALAKIRAADFDLVLLDIQMPVMDGYEVLAELKADAALRALPVIVLSASDESEGVIRCIQMGAEDYLRKPFDPVLLQARINASLEKKRFRDREVSYLRQIQEEKRRTDELLHVILPSHVAAELKQTNAVLPRRFPNVAVLFCDIVGFTPFAERQEPEGLLSYLQSLVERFEDLAARHELEKIKTIGDSFMATAGLLSPLDRPALSAVKCGLDMIVAARELPPHWQVRVGIHVGPVVAGVVGHKKYQYDVWGDTVNTAARMEKAATANTVCVNAQTWELLADACHGQSQGRIQIKGKGDMEIIRVDSVRG